MIFLGPLPDPTLVSAAHASEKDTRARSGSLHVVSLFSGGGGLDLGLGAVGFNTIFASDIDAHSTVSLQWGKHASECRGKGLFADCVVFRDDIKHLHGSFIFDATKMAKGEMFILAGGPPCQAFSVSGKRYGRADARGMLVYEYLRLLSQLRPDVFVLENVSGLLTVEGGAAFRDFCDTLRQPSRSLRYTLSVLRLNAVDYGVPQFRDRLFIVGTRNGKTINEVSPITSNPDHLRLNGRFVWRTVGDALRNLPPIGAAFPANHTGRTHSDRIITRYGNMRAGERDPFTRINKLDLTRPSFTIVVGSDKGGGKGHIHPSEPRELTPRESARIQTFPDWWAFSGTGRHPIRQIGNAVPPLLGAAIGNALREQIFGLAPKPFASILRSLDQTHLFPELQAGCAAMPSR